MCCTSRIPNIALLHAAVLHISSVVGSLFVGELSAGGKEGSEQNNHEAMDLLATVMRLMRPPTSRPSEDSESREGWPGRDSESREGRPGRDNSDPGSDGTAAVAGLSSSAQPGRAGWLPAYAPAVLVVLPCPGGARDGCIAGYACL